MSWFDDEQPSDETKARVEQKLDAIGWMVDCVLSHTCPARYTPTEAFLTGLNQSIIDRSTENWLDTIENGLSYGYWFCGHWHIEKRIDRMHFLMKSYEVLPTLVDCEIEVDEETLCDFTALCEEKNTTIDIAIRAMMRFCIDPKNADVLKSWACR